ncbi:uncharacterized protein BDZ99DRAFT_525856 [Mytilinidion resinicola]|uniref:Uncharacterized protein n=1 Tax=Mytilinidion resinicola TaxID=574789 RepID=A0A6A6Y637_9PEZI|nr:uncharacterized protein BDZ99DRAFT_525856 [Mytilinidion resinicola]KAF2804262.1 hypothetical protein BDZ99DRAFT_525856 [Mytilinidion resinicola]
MATVEMDLQLPTSNTPTPIATPTPTRTPAKDALVLRAVNSAARRSENAGRPNVGKALRRLYDDSRFDRDNAKLLDAVLRKKTTRQQRADFRAFIKREGQAEKKRDRRLKAVKTKTTSQHALPALEHPEQGMSSEAEARALETFRRLTISEDKQEETVVGLDGAEEREERMEDVA